MGELAALTPDEVRALGEQGWLIQDRFLSEGAALQAHGEAQALQQTADWSLPGVGRERDRTRGRQLRGDQTLWLQPQMAPPALGDLIQRFRALRDELNQAYLGLGRTEIQLARYPGDGEGYQRHRDAFAGDASRRVTAICYLNPAWSPAAGGLLRLFTEGVPLEVEPLGGRLVLFLSERIEHEVLPAFAPRFAVTAWYYGSTGG